MVQAFCSLFPKCLNLQVQITIHVTNKITTLPPELSFFSQSLQCEQTMFKLNVIWKKNTGRTAVIYRLKNPPSLSNNLMITWTNKYNPILFNVVSQDKRESNGINLFFVNISISNI